MDHKPEMPDAGTGSKDNRDVLMQIYCALYQSYGPQHWWPASSRLEVIIGAILTQNVAWTNVELALNNLKNTFCFSSLVLRDIPEAELATLLRPAGYFNIKARRLKAFIKHLWDEYHGNLDMLLGKKGDELRNELLSIHGIGEETADDIMLYAAEQTFFVVDTYTRRIIQRVGLSDNQNNYAAYQRLFHDSLPSDVQMFNEYHALLVRHAKQVCRKEPLCDKCCLLDLCPTGRDKVARLFSR